MPDIAVRNKFGKGHLGGELRSHPGHTPAAGLVDFGRRGFALDPLQLCRQRVDVVIGKAGADITLVDQLASLELGHQQRGEGAPSRARSLPADDDELLPSGAFHLHPVAPAFPISARRQSLR